MRKKLNIKKDDTVIVISGNDRGTKGRVLEVIAKTERVIVEGVNIISKHTKPNADNPQGGVVKKEAPIHISNVMVICPKTGKRTRIGRKIGKDGKSVRYSIKSETKQEIK